MLKEADERDGELLVSLEDIDSVGLSDMFALLSLELSVTLKISAYIHPI